MGMFSIKVHAQLDNHHSPRILQRVVADVPLTGGIYDSWPKRLATIHDTIV